MTGIGSVCVFCGSSAGDDSRFADAARQTGRLLAERQIKLVYGGGGVGLMGLVADATLEFGGKVVGVIPRSLADRELAHANLTELHVVGSMHERKALMAEQSDAFIALPGGFGTWEELCEIITWRQLGIHDKPIGLLNVAQFYDPLLEQIERGVQRGFIKPEYRRLVTASENIVELLTELQEAPTQSLPRWLSEDES